MRCEMWWCGTVVMKNATCCVTVTCVISDVENDAKWCDFRCGGVMSDVVVRCKIKIWWCNAMWNMVWCEICCDVECGCGMVRDVDCCCDDVEHVVLRDVVVWNVVPRHTAVSCDLWRRIWWSEVRCVATSTVRCGVENCYVVMWCGMLCNGGVWCGMVWCGRWCDVKIFWCDVCDVKCNLNPTNCINTTALVICNVAGTHTRMKRIAHNFTHTSKVIRVQMRIGGCLRAELNDATDDIYLL